jgi:hypothetical protein
MISLKKGTFNNDADFFEIGNSPSKFVSSDEEINEPPLLDIKQLKDNVGSIANNHKEDNINLNSKYRPKVKSSNVLIKHSNGSTNSVGLSNKTESPDKDRISSTGKKNKF